MSRTLKAEWAARYYHTSVIDAAGAIYVIGGYSYTGSTLYYYQDVWASTNGGARPAQVQREWSGAHWVLQGILQGVLTVLQG
jgi:hypothetical protein